MKVCLVAHGFPPELVGGTENALDGLARGLVQAGAEVVVVAGSLAHQGGFRRSLEDLPVAGGGSLRVHRIHRADLFFDHWQKTACTDASRAFRDVLREERPDVVHVNHWIRLSRDLVHRSALEGVPAVVTLHDLWTSCLVTFRVRPDTGEFCEAPLAPTPCLACAAHVPPRTPWLSVESQGIALLERRADLVRELELARVVLAPSRAHADALTRFLRLDPARCAIEVRPNGREVGLRRRAPLPWDPPRTRLVLGAWGHLYRLKGADCILRAMRRLPDPSRVTLHLAGGEPEPAYAAELRELARGLDVHFHGAYEAARLDQHPASAVHAFVSGTRAHESFGLVLDEAVALGLPMVLPESGAYAERAAGQGGLFYAPGDDADLARALGRLLDDPGCLAALREALPEPSTFTTGVAQSAGAHLEVYARAIAAGAPSDARPMPERELIWKASQEAWDRGLAGAPGEETGLA
jgi:glycosyltransferase involved in cell wall biosynthesis